MKPVSPRPDAARIAEVVIQFLDARARRHDCAGFDCIVCSLHRGEDVDELVGVIKNELQAEAPLQGTTSPDPLQAALAANAQLRQAQRWIPVGERLPQWNLPVLLYWKASNVIEMGCLYEDYWQLERTAPQDELLKFALSDEAITHWMPLPSPPEAALAASPGDAPPQGGSLKEALCELLEEINTGVLAAHDSCICCEAMGIHTHDQETECHFETLRVVANRVSTALAGDKVWER